MAAISGNTFHPEGGRSGQKVADCNQVNVLSDSGSITEVSATYALTPTLTCRRRMRPGAAGNLLISTHRGSFPPLRTKVSFFSLSGFSLLITRKYHNNPQ